MYKYEQTERIKELVKLNGKTPEQMEEMTGMTLGQWKNLMYGRQDATPAHIAALMRLWPEYGFWINTGESKPEIGQISPEIEQARKNSAGALKAG